MHFSSLRCGHTWWEYFFYTKKGFHKEYYLPAAVAQRVIHTANHNIVPHPLKLPIFVSSFIKGAHPLKIYRLFLRHNGFSGREGSKSNRYEFTWIVILCKGKSNVHIWLGFRNGNVLTLFSVKKQLQHNMYCIKRVKEEERTPITTSLTCEAHKFVSWWQKRWRVKEKETTSNSTAYIKRQVQKVNWRE